MPEILKRTERQAELPKDPDAAFRKPLTEDQFRAAAKGFFDSHSSIAGNEALKEKYLAKWRSMVNEARRQTKTKEQPATPETAPELPTVEFMSLEDFKQAHGDEFSPVDWENIIDRFENMDDRLVPADPNYLIPGDKVFTQISSSEAVRPQPATVIEKLAPDAEGIVSFRVALGTTGTKVDLPVSMLFAHPIDELKLVEDEVREAIEVEPETLEEPEAPAEISEVEVEPHQEKIFFEPGDRLIVRETTGGSVPSEVLLTGRNPKGAVQVIIAKQYIEENDRQVAEGVAYELQSELFTFVPGARDALALWDKTGLSPRKSYVLIGDESSEHYRIVGITESGELRLLPESILKNSQLGLLERQIKGARLIGATEKLAELQEKYVTAIDEKIILRPKDAVASL